ncbi:hypothetical protein H5410_000626 [Solanum commersonii]|uniref:Uncharacterized protein n=1 Tax=Solanum commersonii TaxID=4109 RepID=A0A9J6AWD7_SOLCO|nr:hypothetical protein H5410_000626 [Solanum commersonii]
MLSSTFEMIFIASSNSHIIFCLCNLIIAIILLSGFQSSSQDNTNNILEHDMSKRKETQGNPKAKHFHKGMSHLDYQVRKMDTSTSRYKSRQKNGAYDVDACCQYHETAFNPSHYRETSFKSENIEVDRKMDARVTSKEMHTIYVPSEISTIKVLNEINQDNKSEAYDDATRFSSTQSLHQDTNFKCENVERVVLMVQMTQIYLAKTRKENFEENNEKDEDELRKRIEDFIEKINRGLEPWRAEKLGIFYQSQ